MEKDKKEKQNVSAEEQMSSFHLWKAGYILSHLSVKIAACHRSFGTQARAGGAARHVTPGFCAHVGCAAFVLRHVFATINVRVAVNVDVSFILLFVQLPVFVFHVFLFL